MSKLIQNCILSVIASFSIVHADSYQKLITTFNHNESADLLQRQIGKNLSKRIATDAERSNLSFIAIYAELAQQNAKKPLREQILTFTNFANDQINDASLSPQEKQYRINHYVHLVVLTVASCMKIENSAAINIASSDLIKKMKSEISSLQSSLNQDIYNQLMGLSPSQIDRILNEFNFTEAFELAKADIALQETVKGKSHDLKQRLLRLIPDQVIEYQKAFQELNDLMKQYQDRQAARSAGAPVVPSSKFKDVQASLQTALLNRPNQPPSHVRGDSVGSSTEEKKEGTVAGSASTRASLHAMLLKRPKQPPVTTDSDDVDSPADPKSALGALLSGGGDRRSKAEEMRRKSMEAMAETVVSAPKGAVDTDSSDVEDSTAGGWTTDRLQADAARQIQDSNLSDALTEDAYDEDGNEIKISLKEKTRRDVLRLIKTNKQRIDNDLLTIDQLAIQITDFLSKRGFNAYVNPIATKAPTGYKRAEKAPSKTTGTTSASKNTGPSFAEQAQKRLAERQRKQGTSEAASASITPEMKSTFDENINQYDQLQREISESESKQTRLEGSITKKRKDLERIRNRDTSSGTLTEEAKRQIHLKIAELNQQIQTHRREIESIQDEDDKLKGIPEALNLLETSDLTAKEKANQRSQLNSQKRDLESKSKERQTTKKELNLNIRKKEQTIEREKQKLNAGATAEEMNARQKSLEEVIATEEDEYLAIQTKIRKLKVQAIELFTSKGLSAANLEILLAQRQKDQDIRVAQAHAKTLNSHMKARRSSLGLADSGNDDESSDGESSDFEDDLFFSKR